MPNQEITELCDRLVSQLSPSRVYLFGSFADGTNRDESDFDFYIVMGDDTTDLADATTRAYRSIRRLKRRPVDILVGTESGFENGKGQGLKREVAEKGVLLYG